MLAVSPAVAGAATQARDDPSDAPDGPSGKADLRTMDWDVSASSATLTVKLDASTFGGGQRAAIGVHALIDRDADGLADAEVAFARNADGVTVDAALRMLDRTLSTTTCQDLNGKAVASKNAIATTVSGGFETFAYSFDPSLVPGSLAAFHWAAFGQAPADPALKGPWDYLPDAANPDPAALNPSDRRCDAATSGLAVDMKAGVAFPDPEPTPTPTATQTAQPAPTAGPPGKPHAALAIKGVPQAGRPATLDAGGTTPAAGTHIVAYQWDMNGDGHLDTNTGRNPVAHLVIGTASQTVVVHAVDSNFNESTATVTLDPGAAPSGCAGEESIGVLTIRAACIRHEGDRVIAAPQYNGNRFWAEYAVSLNGVALVTRDEHATVTFDTHLHQIHASGVFRVLLLNGPQGDIELYESGPGGFDWPMPADTSHGPGEPTSIFSFQAAEHCSESTTTACAKVPGGFPIHGGIDLGIDTSTREATLDVNVGLHQPITVTGRIRLRTDAILGSVKLDAIGFTVEHATIGVFVLQHLRFLYEPPGTNGHEGDLWDVAIGIVLDIQPPFAVDGRMRFVDGQFNFASADVMFAPGIPIYAGVLLNRFAASFGLHPVSFGGGLGASIITVLQINADFTWGVTNDGILVLMSTGDATLWGGELAHAYMNYWSDGYFAFGGRLGFSYPRTHPNFSIFGETDFWLEAGRGGAPNRYQADSALEMSVYGFTSRVHGFINNDWAAGCWGHALTGSYNWHTQVAHGDIGCDLAPYTFQPTRERPSLIPASTAFSSLAAPPRKAFDVKPGERALVLEIKGQGGAPKLTLNDPAGHAYTPTDTPKKVVTQGNFRSATFPDGSATLVRVDHPTPGEWTLVPQPGSPPIAGVTRSEALPAMKVAAKVRGRGRNRTLTWSAHGLAGRSIRFAERSRTTGKTITVTKAARGRVAFRIQDGSAGRRAVEAQVSAGSRPVSADVVARFRAPGPPRPGRMGKLKLRRSHGTVSVRWPRLAGAQGYIVRVTGSDGRREIHFTGPRKRIARIRTVADRTRLKVSVAGWMGTRKRTGGARVQRVKAVKRKR